MNWRWPWDQSQFEEDATALLVAMKSCLIDMARWQGKFNQQQQQLLTEVGKIMAGIDDIKANEDKIAADVQAILTKLKDLGDQLAAAIANQDDPAKLQAIADEQAATIAALEGALTPAQ